MRHMWQLLRVFRRNLWMCIGVEVVIVFLIALNDVRAQRPESVLDSLGVSAFLALILGLCLRMPSRLNRMPFPVSVRQRAMLPVLAFGVLWGSGIAAILAAAVFFGFSPTQWCLIVVLMLQRMPFYLLLFLMVYRLFQLAPQLFGCIFVFVFLPKIMNDHDDTFWVSWYFLALPAALALIVFYLKEIPKQLAGRDCLLSAQSPNQPVSMRDLNIESRHTLITWMGRVMDAVLTFAVILCLFFITRKSFGEDLARVQTYISKPWLCWFPLSAIFLCYTLLREGYGRAVASGFGPYSSAWMSLMRITIILNPLTKALGVKKGVVAQCDQCRNSKFIWALKCPHCGFPGPGTILNKQMARLARGDTVRISTRQRIIFRLFIPLQLLLMFGVFGMAGSRPFEVHTVLMTFPDAHIAAQAALHIEDWIEAHTETGTWLTSHDLSLQIPKRCRLQVVYYPVSGYMRAEAYGLRWDSEAKLPAMVAERLGESLPEAVTFTTTPMKSQDASSPFWQTRTYLDNRIHWVEGEETIPRKTRKNLSAPLPIRVE